MARRRSATSATGGNLDSMLDTLTNVVGILVIVLVTVQLSSQEAASRIAAEATKIDPEEVARIEREAEEAARKAEEAAEALEAERKEVRNPKQRLMTLESEAAVLDELAKQADAQREAEARKRAAEMTAAEKKAQEAEKLERERKEAEKRLEEMRRELENLPALVAPPAKEVRLPDPRPAPPNTKELHVLCREGRLWVVDLDDLREKAIKRADYVVRARKLDPDGDKWITEGERFVEEFNKAPVKEDGFEMTLIARGTVPYLLLTRAEKSGQAAEDAIKGNGLLARTLRRTKPDAHIVRFFVWPDSFETYLTARAFTGERGYAAGWSPTGSPDEYTISLGTYRLGEKPPPPPPPPAGTPAPPPTPKPPPPNVVD